MFFNIEFVWLFYCKKQLLSERKFLMEQAFGNTICYYVQIYECCMKDTECGS